MAWQSKVRVEPSHTKPTWLPRNLVHKEKACVQPSPLKASPITKAAGLTLASIVSANLASHITLPRPTIRGFGPSMTSGGLGGEQPVIIFSTLRSEIAKLQLMPWQWQLSIVGIVRPVPDCPLQAFSPCNFNKLCRGGTDGVLIKLERRR